ncbi:collagen-like protein [Cytophagaceae bacterium ABcell3]|nr:collagen-like protein [Cytophagaceae bacterium ABcell3]
MKLKSFLGIACICALVAIFSCRGKDGDPGPQGPEGEQGIQGPRGPSGADGADGENYDPNKIWTEKEGYVQGKFAGTTSNGVAYEWDIDFRGIMSRKDNYYRQLNDHVIIRVYKAYAEEGESFTRASFQLELRVDDLETLSNPAIVSAHFSGLKELDDHTIFRAERSFTPGTSGFISSLSNLSYDASSRTISGDFQMSFPRTSEGEAFSINNASFSSELVQIVAREGR